MVDIVDKATRSRMMSGIRGRDTQPELAIRHYLHSRGLRYRLNVRSLPGKPDLVFPRYRVAVFVHGCFWHRHPGCRFATTPASNAEFWQKKFDDNVRRDKVVNSQLRKPGWKCIVFWECKVGNSAALKRLEKTIRAAGTTASPRGN